MNNEQTTGRAGAATPAWEEKTFTQEQVNAIVGERLAKEKGKTEAVLSQREQELAQREIMLTAREKLGTMGLSLDLLEALNMTSAEALDKSLAILEKTINGQSSAGTTPARAYFQNPPSGVVMKGSTGGPHGSGGISGDNSVRKAMGLN